MRLMLACAAALSLAVPSFANAHGGGLNSCGCHYNRKTGDCHCHQDRGCGCSCQPGYCGGRSDADVLEGACGDGELVLPVVQARSTKVRGYTKKDGTYVAPHRRSSPDKSKSNNWGTKGNVNPYTGKEGTKNDT